MWFARLTVGNGIRRPSPAVSARALHASVAHGRRHLKHHQPDRSVVNPIALFLFPSPDTSKAAPRDGSLEPERSPRPAGMVLALRAGAVQTSMACCPGRGRLAGAPGMLEQPA